MIINHIIVQAGGKGTRLEHLTTNKPKALVPVMNLPILFHLFNKFPKKKFIIIADYKSYVLRQYLECFADVIYTVIDADGCGTCSGLRQAVEILPDGEAFMLVWSDLILSDQFEIPKAESDYVGLTNSFQCRWKHMDGTFIEEQTIENGVAGLFLFRDKTKLTNVPKSGELVRWFKEQRMEFEPLMLEGTHEFGTLYEYEKTGVAKTRPFNRMTISGETVIKEPTNERGQTLAAREKAWYEYAMTHGIVEIPRIFSTKPLVMERIEGRNIYECEPSIDVLEKIIKLLEKLHNLERVPSDVFSMREAYYGKTINRLDKIRNLVPFSNNPIITVNGKDCRNVFFYRREFECLLENINCHNFTFIHGDCTFSNIMLASNGDPILIDPRGYFGYTELYGDPKYDWAKLYYSIAGNYDRFNLKQFRLHISANEVNLDIESNGWEILESDFFRICGEEEQTIKLLHAVIWLSLTTYAWQDYDSICGAFYNGLWHLAELW